MAIIIIIKRMIEMRMIREIITMTRHRWRVNGPPIRSLGQKQRSHDLRQVIIINISIIIFNILLIIFTIIIINIPLIIINISIIIFNILLIIFINLIILILIFNIILLLIMTVTRGSGILQSDRGSGHIHSR